MNSTLLLSFLLPALVLGNDIVTPPADGQGQGDLTVTELERLQDLLGDAEGEVLLPHDDDFHSNSVPYSAACLERPKAVFLPSTEASLREIVLALVAAKAEFVVATARLNQNCLSTTSGYLINMRRFHTLDFDREKLTARLGAGLLGDEVNDYMQSQGDYYVDGLICTWGGVVGPIFGGGYSWHLNYAVPGSMADNTLSFRFMDYKGDVYTVSETEHPDLYWALRGGGGQLGIVLEVTMRVFERTSPFTVSTWIINGLDTSEKKLAIMDRVGFMYNDLPDSMGLWSMATAEEVSIFIICDWCNPEKLMGQYFAEAVKHPGFAAFEGEMPMHMAYSYIRALTQGYSGQPQRDPTTGYDYDEVYEAYPVLPLTLAAWFFAEHSEEVMPVYRDVLEAETAPGTTIFWSTFISSNAMDSTVESAESTHKDARLVWSLATLTGAEELNRIFYNGMAKIDTGRGSYWNYSNKYTSEEFSFTTNLPRIRQIRKKYDPEGVFKTPERKYQGSKLLEVCYDRYHCSGNGRLQKKSRNGIPKNGRCRCACEPGWKGDKCQTKVALIQADKCEKKTNQNNSNRSEKRNGEKTNNGED